jgi:hypothetical protein
MTEQFHSTDIGEINLLESRLIEQLQIAIRLKFESIYYFNENLSHGISQNFMIH